MRIAHVDTGTTWRGGQAQVLALALGLAARGHEAVVFCPEGPLAERGRAAGLCVQRFAARSDLDFVAGLRLAGELRRMAPDVVHLHSARAHAVGAWAARAAGGLPVVVSRRVDFEVAEHPLSALKYRVGVDRYLCISEGVRRVLARGGVPAARLRVVPSGIDLGRWRTLPDPAPLRARLGLASGTPVVGNIAALAPHKDQHNLLGAAAALARRRPDARWVVFGEGELRSALEAERRRLGLEQVVLLPGFVERVEEAMALLAVFVLSSYLEGLGTSVLDAQAAGVPVVATAVGGVPEMVEDGATGWLVPARDPAALAAAVEDALAHPREAARRAAAGRVAVARFAIERTVALTEAAYAEVLAERAGRAR
jgi:glycosyltransferase involved in cell wall biosynthesis